MALETQALHWVGAEFRSLNNALMIDSFGKMQFEVHAAEVLGFRRRCDWFGFRLGPRGC